ncbi:MAG TPA: outer membrane beta-barrel protein [Acidisoma sp.]|nr:outer membrane beta-barrel protein [Acidisoma sp.]
MLGTGLAGWAVPAQAQSAAAYFPTGVYGYDQDLGVTVLSRARPGYETSGVALGGFTIRPELDQSIFDNSNVNGTAGSNSGSWGSETTGTVTGASDWSRNSLQTSLGFDHYSFFALPGDNYTNWNVGVGGGYTIAGGELRAAYSHSTYNQLGTQIGQAQSESPSQNTTDTGEIAYDFNLGRVTITPSVDFSAYRFGNITQNGVQTSQSAFDRNVVAAGVLTRYALTGGTGLLLVTRGSSSNYIDQPAGQLSNSSVSGMVLAGLDYQPEAVWRYSILVGVETRSFSASQYGTYTAPVLSGQLVWTPEAVFTMVGDLSRTIEDADTTGNSGYVLNDAKIVGDYELMRNVLLEGRVDLQYASYLQGGSQTNEAVGGSVTWLLNRHVRLSLDDDFTNQNAPGSMTQTITGPGQLSGAYKQNLLVLTLHIAL